MRRFSSVRLAAIGTALACVLALVPLVPASAHSDDDSPSHKSYLALGDSVPFGYNPLLVTPGVAPSAFVGYPELLVDYARPKLRVANASCPGETSTSMITGTRPDHGCQNYRQYVGALHESYTGSQLDYATNFLATNPRTKLVSVMIGANDALMLQDECVGLGGDVNSCITNGLGPVLYTLRANLTTIYSALRAQGYRGEFVAVTYYSTDYRDPTVTGSISAIDAVLVDVTKSFGGTAADGFAAFERAAKPYGGDTCAAGLLIRLTPSTCNIHPSPAGAALLAAAVQKTHKH
ncbi:hypothetical protein JF66_02210 [Cryobacterium sp. MLB-32]|uniref:SGNH/GDSL hydrolase family protein n=1 Tax=Cryobacterium sp. MLB-32 TaxID=1529318 RepID=UPI0004E673B1|nr:GDSL-type esterase/lipase family protein [Cryobacterium sp. MLB-32]KFF60809.1 hypothetical protein JF66_02210 [Cryobacterium sp. MLB-32]